MHALTSVPQTVIAGTALRLASGSASRLLHPILHVLQLQPGRAHLPRSLPQRPHLLPRSRRLCFHEWLPQQSLYDVLSKVSHTIPSPFFRTSLKARLMFAQERRGEGLVRGRHDGDHLPHLRHLLWRLLLLPRRLLHQRSGRYRRTWLRLSHWWHQQRNEHRITVERHRFVWRHDERRPVVSYGIKTCSNVSQASVVILLF